jgi:uncharacterized membrane protein YfcA
MGDGWQLTIVATLVILFLAYSILAIIRHWKHGYKEVLKNLAQAPLRLLVGIGAIYALMTEKTWLLILLVSVLFLIVYFTSRQHNQDIQEIRKEEKKNGKK